MTSPGKPAAPDDGGAGEEAAAEVFERHRPYLRALAYRILGTVGDAEDVVQEAWPRFARAERGSIAEPRAWLTVVVGRIALDVLTSARVRRESYVGPWLPEPLLGGAGDGSAPSAVPLGAPPPDTDPADRVTLDESVTMAMLVVLETLSPAERTALVLHDVFGFDFPEVAAVTGRSPEASRALASRARRHVRARSPRFRPDPVAGARLAEAFLVAAGGGDLAALVELLDPDVVLRSDGGGRARAAQRPVAGAARVGAFLVGLVAKLAREAGDPARLTIRTVVVNGGPGFATYLDGELTGVVALGTDGERVRAVDIVVNPDKLAHLTGRLQAEPTGGPRRRLAAR